MFNTIFFWGICLVYVILIIKIETDYRKAFKKACNDFDDFGNFLNELRHGIHSEYNISDALEGAVGEISASGVSTDARQILEYFYNAAEPVFVHTISELENYEYLLFTVIRYIREYGDSEGDERECFMKSCGMIKQEADYIRIKLLKMKNMFMGIFPVIFIPVLSLGIIKSWGISTIEELKSVYGGTYGRCIVLFLFMLSVFIYAIFYVLRNSVCTIKCNKNKRFTSGFLDRYVSGWMLKNYQKAEQYRKKIIYCAVCIEVHDFIKLKLISIISGIITGILFFMFLMNESITEAVIMFTGSVLFFRKIPELWLAMCMMTKKKRISDEILRLQGIVNILKDMEGITVYGIIEALEEVSVIYKTAIRSCLLNMSMDEKEALKNLAESCADERDMVRLCESIMRCDIHGVKAALEDIGQERRFNYGMNVEKEENSMKNTGALAGFITFIPLAAVIILYLIIPFVYVSMTELSEMAAAADMAW